MMDIEKLKIDVLSNCRTIRKQNVEKWKIENTEMYVNLDDFIEQLEQYTTTTIQWS